MRGQKCHCLKCTKPRVLTRHHVFPARFFKIRKKGVGIPVTWVCRTCHDVLEIWIPKVEILDRTDYLVIFNSWLFWENGAHKSKQRRINDIFTSLRDNGPKIITSPADRDWSSMGHCVSCGNRRRLFTYNVFPPDIYGNEIVSPYIKVCATCFMALEEMTPAVRLPRRSDYILLAQSFLYRQHGHKALRKLLKKIGPIIGVQNQRVRHKFFPDDSPFNDLIRPIQ